MFKDNKNPKLTMGQKLKMFRELKNLSQEELGAKLSISAKTVSAWENGEREINLNNAKIICEFFNIPNTYFVFDENFNKLDSNLKKDILTYHKNYENNCKVETIISMCKKKIQNDGLPVKKEYIPLINLEKNTISHYGLFDKKTLPIKLEKKGISELDKYYQISFDDENLENENKYQYSSKMLTDFGLLDILERFNSDKVELTDLINCNNLETFESTLEKIKNRKYEEKNIFLPIYIHGKQDPQKKYLQDQLNEVLENLNPNLSKFWEIIIFLIDNGAYYIKQKGLGSDITLFSEQKDVSKTNIVYRLAKDNIKKQN